MPIVTVCRQNCCGETGQPIVDLLVPHADQRDPVALNAQHTVVTFIDRLWLCAVPSP